MATHDFLHIARVEGDRPFTAASLPSAKELHALSVRCGAARDSLRLCHLTPEQTATLGDASTLEEVRLNQRLVRLCARFPQLLQGLQRAPTLLQDAFDTEQALRQVGGMYAQLRGAARAGTIVLSADLTELVDRVEATAVKALSETGTPTAERAALRAQISPHEQARLTVWSRVDARRQRSGRRQSQAAATQAQAQDAQAVLEQEATLRGQPTLIAPAPAKAPAKQAPRSRKPKGA